MKKIFSAILFFLAAWFIAAGILNAVFRSRVGLEPEYAVVCILPLLGALLAWWGVNLWKQS
jgi:uncharacterized membrane protein HdeD (DUF308 family)